MIAHVMTPTTSKPTRRMMQVLRKMHETGELLVLDTFRNRKRCFLGEEEVCDHRLAQRMATASWLDEASPSEDGMDRLAMTRAARSLFGPEGD